MRPPTTITITDITAAGMPNEWAQPRVVAVRADFACVRRHCRLFLGRFGRYVQASVHAAGTDSSVAVFVARIAVRIDIVHRNATTAAFSGVMYIVT